MIGQSKLQSKLQAHIDNGTLPRTLLFEGARGCGKHTLCNELAAKLNLVIEDITDRLTLDTLQDIMLRPSPYIYIIDCSKLSVKEQNVILKFLEEPLKNSYICMLCEFKYRLLPTVLNRCQCFSFEQYTQEELSQFVDFQISPEVLRYMCTPGMVLKSKSAPVDNMISLSKQIFEKISIASYSNILSIPTTCYYKEEKENLLEFDLFVYILINVAHDKYLNNEITYEMYQLTDTFYNDCYIFNINKQQLFEHFVIELKQLFEGR